MKLSCYSITVIPSQFISVSIHSGQFQLLFRFSNCERKAPVLLLTFRRETLNWPALTKSGGFIQREGIQQIAGLTFWILSGCLWSCLWSCLWNCQWCCLCLYSLSGWCNLHPPRQHKHRIPAGSQVNLFICSGIHCEQRTFFFARPKCLSFAGQNWPCIHTVNTSE